MFGMKQKMKQKKRDPVLRVRKSTLYAIIEDIEALHERVHEIAYAQFERPLRPAPATGMGNYPGQPTPLIRIPSRMGGWGSIGPTDMAGPSHYPPSPPSPEHLTPWYAQGIPDYTQCPTRHSPPPRYNSMHGLDSRDHSMGGIGPMEPRRPTLPDSRPRSPIARRPERDVAVCRARWALPSPYLGAYETPNVTHMAPDRRTKWDRRAKKEKKRKRSRKGKELAEESSEETESEEGGSDEDDETQVDGYLDEDPAYLRLGSPRMQVRG